MSTCEKITRTKCHVYLKLSAKRAFVRTYINMHARKNSRILYLFAKYTARTREKNHLGLLLNLSSKDTAIELMYINMHVRGNSRTFGNDSYSIKIRLEIMRMRLSNAVP